MTTYPPNHPDPTQSDIEPQPVTHKPLLQKQLRALAMRDHSRDQAPKATVAGVRFGRVVTQRGVGYAQPGHRLLVLFHCDCGEAGIKRFDQFAGGTKSCGCLLDSKSPKFKIRSQIRKAVALLDDKRASAAEQKRNSPHTPNALTHNMDRRGIKAIDDFESQVSDDEPFTELYVALDMSQDELNKRALEEQRLHREEARRLIESDGNTSWHNYESD